MANGYNNLVKNYKHSGNNNNIVVWQESVDTIVCMNEEFITKAEIGNNEVSYFFLVAHDMIRLVADKWFMAGPSRIAYTDTRKILEH